MIAVRTDSFHKFGVVEVEAFRVKAKIAITW